MKPSRPLITTLVLSLSLVLGATAGSLTPPGAVGSTMNTLAEIYNAIAGTFDSSAITADQNGSLIENLKYIESNLAWASGSNNIWNLNSGNVGIGTVSPEGILDVRAADGSGVVLFRSPDSTGSEVNSPILRLGGSYDAIPGIGLAATSVSFEFQTIADTNAFRLTTSFNSFSGTTLLTTLQSDGNFGIGTSLPEQKLEVAGSILASASGDIDLTLRSTDSEDARFTLRSAGASDRLDILGSVSQVYFTILKGGNIGIGDTTPESLFEVSGGTASVSLFSAGFVVSNLIPNVTDTYDLGTSALRWRDLYLASGSLHIGASGDEAVIDYNVGNDYLAFKPDGTNTRLAVLDAGNVGIGTVTPGDKLNIFGTGNALRLSYDADNYTRMSVDSNGHLFVDGVDAGIGGGANILLATVDGGNVGIGTTTPDTTLDVAGGITTQTLFGAGLAACDGTGDKLAWSSSGLFSCGSDQTGGGGGGGAAINVREFGGGGTFNDLAVATLSFNGTHFALVASGTEDVSIKLDWINGPASRSIDQTITGVWTFSNGASVSSQLEVLGIASISNAIWASPTGIFAGNVGVGTTEPLARLNVLGTTNSLRLSYDFENYGELYVDSTGTLFIDSVRTSGPTNPYNVVLATTGGNVGIGEVLPDAKLEVTGGAASISNALYVESGGNVGIGNTTPNAKLDVSGAVMASSSAGDAEFILNAASIVGGKFTLQSGIDGIASEKFQVLNALDQILMSISSIGNVEFLPTEGSAEANVSLTYHGSQDGNDYSSMRNTVGQFRIQVDGTLDTFYLNIGRDSSVNDFAYIDATWLNESDDSMDDRPLILNPSGGAVSIGTTAPIAALEVRPSTSFGGPLFLVASNSNERFRITSGGNVGIGTGAPREKLEVKGGIFIAASGSSVVDYILSAERIGSPIPDDRLTITSSGTHNRVWLDTTGIGGAALSLATNGNERLALGQTSSNSYGLSIYNNEHFRIQTGNTSVTQKFILTTDGRIAVGTTATASFFTIQGSDGATGTNGVAAPFVLRVTGGTGGAALGVAGTGGEGASMSFTAGNGGAGGVVGGGGSGGHIRIIAGDGGSGGSFNGPGGSIALMPGTGATAGGVGVGTLLPSNPLHVVGGTGQVYPLRLETTGGGGIANYEGTTFRGSWSAGSTAAFSVLDQSATNHRFTVLQTGLVGVGNTAPQTLVHIGSASTTDGRTLIRLQDSNSTCNFTADAGSPTCGSDLRLKKDIEDLSVSALDRLTALNVVTYRWKTDTSGSPVKTGFIAQNVQEYFPDLVSVSSWGDGEPALFLSQSGLIPYLVKAVQEQQEMIDALRAGFNSTESVLAENDSSLLNRIAALFKDILGIEFGQGSVTVERLCVGSVCVTEEQFMEVFGSGAEPAETPEPSSEATPTPSPDESSAPEPEPSAEVSAEPSPEPTLEPEETAESTPEPEPEPSSEVVPEVQAPPPVTENDTTQN